jgi:hypothetical protein
MAASLGTLLSRTWAFTKKNYVPLLVAGLVMGLILVVIQSIMMQSFQSGMQNGLGLDTARITDLQKRIQAGDQQALQEYQQEMENLGKKFADGGPGASIAAGMLQSVFGVVALTALLAFIISMLYNGYILLLVLHEGTPPKALVSRLPRLLLPLIGLSLWTAIRTFVWIPFVGIITLIILGPRFALAPLILVKDGKGVFESATLSYRQTRGYWGKIIGNVIVAGICAGVAAWIVNIVVSMVLGGAAFYVTPIVQMIAQGFTIAFVAFLGLSILSAGAPAPRAA